MVIPILPIVAGIAGGALASNAFTKKGLSTVDSHNIQTTSTDSRAFNIQYPTTQIQIDSPLASQSTKKEQAASSEATPTVTSSSGSGIDFSPLIPVALILGGALIIKEVI